MKPKSASAIVAASVGALLLLSGVAAISYRSTLRMDADEGQVEHTQEVMAVIEQLVKLVNYDAVSHRGYLITGDEMFLAKHEQTLLERVAAVKRLRGLIDDNPAQRERLVRMVEAINLRETLARNHVELRRNDGFETVRKMVATGRGERILGSISDIASEMSDNERTLLAMRLKRSEASSRATRWTIVCGSLVAFSLVAGSLWWLTSELAERVRGDAALRKSEQRFRALISASSDLVYQMTPDWGELVQLESHDFIAPSKPGNPNWLQEYIHPEDRERATAGIQKAIRGKLVFEMEHRVLQADGGEGWLFSRTVPILNAAGEITKWFGAASDITARKRAEAALMENEELLRFAMSTEQTGLWVVNFESGDTDRSFRHDEIFGYTSSLPKWRFEDFTAHIEPEDREWVVRLVENGVATGEGWDFECRIHRVDGTVRWIRVAGRALGQSSATSGKRFAGIIRDITGRRQADEVAHQNEQFKATVLDAIPAEIVLLDRSGVILAVNDSWIQFDRESTDSDDCPNGPGANYLEVSRRSAESGDRFAAAALAGIGAVLSREMPEFFLEYPYQSATDMRWFLLHAVAAPGEPGGAILVHTDITSRKQAEQALSARTAELETIMREVPIAILIGHGSDSSLITTNPAGLRMLRVEDPTNVALDSPEVSYRIFRDGREMLAEELPIQRAASTARPVLESELEVLFADGDRRRMLGNAVPLFDDEGRVTGSLGTFIDITERKAAEDALQNFNDKLTAAVVERTAELGSTVHVLKKEIAARRRLEGEILDLSEREQTRLGQDLHDNLGQQLAGISMLSQALSKDLRNDGHSSAADAMQIAHCLTESIHTTRNIAKSLYPVELERGDLILALQDLAQRTKFLSKVECSVSANSPFHFEKPTEIHLYRIVQESINNALKHGKATEIQIDCVADPERWTMTVTDNGSGFLAQDPAMESGMGLHIFQYRAALIGAVISVRGGPQGGCVVTCSMPLPPSEA